MTRTQTVLPILCLLCLLCACSQGTAGASDAPAPAAEKTASDTPEVFSDTVLDLSSQPASALEQLSSYPKLETLNLRGMQGPDISLLSACSTLKKLDIRDSGITVEEYTLLAAALPGCEILWSIPLGDTFYDSDIVSLALETYSEELPELLPFFPSLQQIDASACDADAALYALSQQYPGLRIQRQVTMCGTCYESSEIFFDFNDCTVSCPEDLDGLQYLDSPAEVDLTGSLRSLEEMEALAEAYPNVTFLFRFSLNALNANLKLEADGYTEELILNRYKITDLNLLRRYLNLLPGLKQLEMCSCGVSNEDMAQLRADYPNVKVVWQLTLAGYYKLRTDIVAFSTLIAEDTQPRLTSVDCELFRYCTDLKALDLGHNRITDLSFLQYTPELRVLILASCKITDLSPLSTLEHLHYLELFSNSGIQTLEPLRALHELREINISYLKAADYDVFWELTSLERLWMNSTPATAEDVAALQEHLPDCTVFARQDVAVSGWRDNQTRYYALLNMFNDGTYLDPIFDDYETDAAEAER